MRELIETVRKPEMWSDHLTDLTKSGRFMIWSNLSLLYLPPPPLDLQKRDGGPQQAFEIETIKTEVTELGIIRIGKREENEIQIKNPQLI